MCVIKSDRGFTIIEFLVSVVILSVGLLGLLQSVNLAISTNLGTKLRNEASIVADEALATRTAQLSSTDTAAFTAFSSSASTRRFIYGGYKDFGIKTVGQPVSNSIQVNVTVNWSHKNTAYTHNASTILSKR